MHESIVKTYSEMKKIIKDVTTLIEFIKTHRNFKVLTAEDLDIFYHVKNWMEDPANVFLCSLATKSVLPDDTKIDNLSKKWWENINNSFNNLTYISKKLLDNVH